MMAENLAVVHTHTHTHTHVIFNERVNKYINKLAMHILFGRTNNIRDG